MTPANPQINWASALERDERAPPVHALVRRLASRPLLVIAPHPDDESIGCGGLIAACAAASIPVCIHYLTDGRHSHPDSVDWPPERIARAREREAATAAVALGVPVHGLRFAREIDGALLFDADALERALEGVEQHARELGDPVIAAPWLGDPHPDHIAGAIIAERLQMLRPNSASVRYIVWSDRTYASCFEGAHSFDIGAYLQHKLRAIHAYETQTGVLIRDCARPNPLPALRASDLQEEFYLLSAL